MSDAQPVVLTIAGFDPSSGAGVTADLKTMAAHNCYGVACITALTVQSTKGVLRVEPMQAGLVTETLLELAADLEIAAVHIGALGSGSVAEAVADFLTSSKPPNVVLDPILQSSSGANLLDLRGVEVMKQRLLPVVTVLTPNIDEAAQLTGRVVTNLDEMRSAASKLHAMGCEAVVVTGGHLDRAIDLLSFQTPRGIQREVFKAPRQRSSSTHGTGCAFSTAMACHLAQGRGLPEAVLLAKAYVSAAIANSRPLGHGTGPVNHLYRMNRERRPVVQSLRKHIES
ncbi:MAG: bifunctional hydroxymethylpyrimidine kinase/phosphomethylpyrimidine kinase [Acidobacteriota bacterium]|nr:bifunctional hydroxymethylpyrimidine kinase/phosphomethylpyrimidine kinase [Acidobacteriota bacterium]